MDPQTLENQYLNFTNPIEGIEGGVVDYEESEEQVYDNFQKKTASVFESIMLLTFRCGGIHPNHFDCARFTMRTVFEFFCIFGFIGFLISIFNIP